MSSPSRSPATLLMNRCALQFDDVILANHTRPITIGDLRAIRVLMDNTEDCDKLDAALERCKGQARDNVERIESVQSEAEVWSKWLGAGNVQLDVQIAQWQEIAVLTMIAIDDLSSMIQYMPADSAEGRARNAKTREDAEAFLKSTPIANFVTKAAWGAEYPDLLGVISLLDNQELTFKTMWSRTVSHALEMDNAQIVNDQLQRFKEDITRHSLGADFQISVIQRLSSKLKELRLRNLGHAMVDADAQAVQTEISRMLNDGSIVTPGDALKLLTEGDNGDGFKATAITMATTMIANAEAKAIQSRQ